MRSVARTAKGSIGAAESRGAMAACARANRAKERARMAEECPCYPGATASAARPSESVAEGTEEADLLASASKRALDGAQRGVAVWRRPERCSST
eukprot:3880919-Pleurochrysis_carterae.AAC.1